MYHRRRGEPPTDVHERRRWKGTLKNALNTHTRWMGLFNRTISTSRSLTPLLQKIAREDNEDNVLYVEMLYHKYAKKKIKAFINIFL
jgi:hypothetical protein